jgi:hypothetical protein
VFKTFALRQLASYTTRLQLLLEAQGLVRVYTAWSMQQHFVCSGSAPAAMAQHDS